MFKDCYITIVNAPEVEGMVNRLGKHGLKFKMGPERSNENGTWYRRFTVYATPWQMRRFVRATNGEIL